MNKFIKLLFYVKYSIQLFVAFEKYFSEAQSSEQLQYKASYTTLMPMYNAATKTTMLIPQAHSAQYLVTITYEGISETFDDKTLYESVKEGDIIQMILCKGYDEDDNLIKQTLQFPE